MGSVERKPKNDKKYSAAAGLEQVAGQGGDGRRRCAKDQIFGGKVACAGDDAGSDGGGGGV